MSIPVSQMLSVGKYILTQKLKRREKYPLVLMLEPLFRCNLACAGCGKIDYPDDILNQRLSVDDCIDAVEQCGAPIVSIAGGEPLLHHELPEIVQAITDRKKYVYLCTNALLMEKKLDAYTPSPYLTFSIHLDGEEETHDRAVCQEGVFTQAVAAIKMAVARGFRVTINCTLMEGESPEEVASFFDFVMGLGVEGFTVSPAFNYERAPDQSVFLQRATSKRLFREILRKGKGRGWAFNQSALYLDFLAGNQTYQCTPWGNPTRNVFGWQKPCYLLVNEGYAPTFDALMSDTDWNQYRTGTHPKCAQCMAHCGYEPTAVNDTVAHPFKALTVALGGPRLDGPLAPEVPGLQEPTPIPVVPNVQLQTASAIKEDGPT